MKHMNEKGQAIIEFAVVLYFFLMLVFGIIYSGMLFYDYNTLSNTARSVARERAITEYSVTNEKILERYVKDGKFTYGLVTSLYMPNDPPIEIVTDEDDIIVTISMHLEQSSALMRAIIPENYAIRYHMRKDFVDEEGGS